MVCVCASEEEIKQIEIEKREKKTEKIAKDIFLKKEGEKGERERASGDEKRRKKKVEREGGIVL